MPHAECTVFVPTELMQLNFIDFFDMLRLLISSGGYTDKEEDEQVQDWLK